MAIKSDGNMKDIRPSMQATSSGSKNKPTRKAASRLHLPYDVPIARTKRCEDGYLNSDPRKKWKKLAAEAKRCYVGPMSVDEFIETFLPAGSTSDDLMPPAKDAFKMLPTHLETDVRKKLCEVMNSDGRCPQFKLRIMSDHFDEPASHDCLLPDISLYDEDILDNVLHSGESRAPGLRFAELFVQIRADSKSNDPFSDPADENDITDFSFFRNDENVEDDGESDDDNDDQETRQNNIGQIATYAAELCARQHRTHCFSISIYGTTVRLFRWDRAGVIISRSFDLHERPELLCLFAWRYCHATDAQRGFDVTVTKATREEESKFKDVVEKHIKDQLSPADDELAKLLEKHYEPNAVFKIPIVPQQPPDKKKSEPNDCLEFLDGIESLPHPWDEAWEDEVAPDGNAKILPSSTSNDTSSSTTGVVADDCVNTPVSKAHSSRCRKYSRVQHFLVSVPVVAPVAAAARGTRGYWAVRTPDLHFEETEYEIAFLKDTWRDDSEGMEVEGETVVELVEAGVKFVSDIHCQGDVQGESEFSKLKQRGPIKNQETLTDAFTRAAWNCNKKIVAPQIHYRMASVEVGYPLSTFRGTKELIHGGRCAYLGKSKSSWATYVLCRRLHRDISLNNMILVRKNGRWRLGILIDWELSSKVGKDGKVRDDARSGTWTFMSIASLFGRKDFNHRFQDDMESFFYVILYASVLWLPHKPVDDIGKHVSLFFDECNDHNGRPRGGSLKNSNRCSSTFYEIWEFENDSLKRWLEIVRDLQWPTRMGEQPEWTPKALYDQWKSTDEENLPLNDRVDHLVAEQPKECEQKPETADLNTTEPSENSIPPGYGLRSSNIASRSSSKRSANDAGFEGQSESSKRQRHSGCLVNLVEVRS